MTAIAPDTAKLQELEEETRQAWFAYREGLQELSGADYEQAESESWALLQSELRRLERQRRLLSVDAQPAA